MAGRCRFGNQIKKYCYRYFRKFFAIRLQRVDDTFVFLILILTLLLFLS